MPNDREIEAFILDQPRTVPYSDLERAVRARFGADCGWNRDRIVAFWQQATTVKPGTPSRLDQDPEVRQFIDDRLFRLTLDEIHAACLEAFGATRTPARSSLHRYSQRVRRK